MAVNQDAYRENPDGYWERRGGHGYMSSLTHESRVASVTQGRFFLELIIDTNPKSLLDFGCGTGKHFGIWRVISGGVIAYDRSRSMIEVSHETQGALGTDYAIIHGNSSNRVSLPFIDGQFDMIAACEVLPHVLNTDIFGVVSEFNRILSPGGIVGAVVTPEDRVLFGHSSAHDYKKLFSSKGFDVTYDADHDGYRFLVAEKRGADGQQFGDGSPRRHLAFSKNEAVGASKPTWKPDAGEVSR